MKYRKLTPEGFARLEEIATAILEGRASLASDYRLPKRTYQEYPGERKYGREKVLAVLKEFQTSQKNIQQVAKEYRLPMGTVARLSWFLKQTTGKKRLPSGSLRNPARITGEIQGAELEQWMDRLEPRIKKVAGRLAQNVVVRSAGLGKEDIEQYCRDRLRWKLQTFDLKRKTKGKNREDKINRFCSAQISFSSGDILRNSRKKHAKTNRTIEPAAKPMEQLSVTEIKANLRKKHLTPNEITLVLARLAGMSLPRIGRVLNATQSRVSQLFIPIKPVVGIRKLSVIQSRRPK
jgi:hypothetical protein